MIELGSRVRDKITDFVGLAVARIEYLNGSVSVGVQRRELHDGKPVDVIWIDEKQLELGPGEV